MSNPYDAQGQGPGQQNPQSGDGAWSSQPYPPNPQDGAAPPPPGAYGQAGEAPRAPQGAPAGPPQGAWGAGQPMPYDQERDSSDSGPQPASIVRGPRQPGGTPAWTGPSARGGVAPAGPGVAPADQNQQWGQPAPGDAPAAPADHNQQWGQPAPGDAPAAPADHNQQWGQPDPGAAPAAPGWDEQPQHSPHDQQPAPGWGEQPQHSAHDQQPQPQEQDERSAPGWGAAAAGAGVGAAAAGAGAAAHDGGVDSELAPEGERDTADSTARPEEVPPAWGSPGDGAPQHSDQQSGEAAWSGQPQEPGPDQAQQSWGDGGAQPSGQSPGDSGSGWGAPAAGAGAAAHGRDDDRDFGAPGQADARGEEVAHQAPQEAPAWGEQGQQAPAEPGPHDAAQPPAPPAWGEQPVQQESDQHQAPPAPPAWGEQPAQPEQHQAPAAPGWGEAPAAAPAAPGPHDAAQPPAPPAWGEQPLQQESDSGPGWGAAAAGAGAGAVAGGAGAAYLDRRDSDQQDGSPQAPPVEQNQPHSNAPGGAAPIDHQPAQPGADDAGVGPGAEAEELPTQVTPAVSEPPTGDEPADEALTIGRGRANSIVLDDMLVSRQHVRIIVDDEGLVLEDLGSRNGTFVNGRRVERTHLHEGDRIGIGASTFEVRDGWLVSL